MTTMAAVSTVALGIGGIAWACTASAYISVNPESGAARSTVTVGGGGFTDGPVEIRWNDAKGPVIGHATGPAFSVAVQIPEVAPGVYTIMAFAYAPGGTATVGEGRFPFQVTAASSSSSTEPGSGGSTAGSVNSRSKSTQPSSGSSASGGTGAAEEGGATPQAAPAGAPLQPGADANSFAVAPGAAGSEARASRGQRSSSSTAAAAVAPPAGRHQSGTAGGPSMSPAPSATAVSDDEPKAAPPASARTTTSDLWSGFGPVPDGAPRGASMLEAPAEANGSSHLALGVGLFTGGVLALSALGLAAARRQRTPVHGARR